MVTKMSPMYNPEDWDKEFDLTLKYEPMSETNINRMLVQYKHDDVLDYIKQLWNLIDYQRKVISEQTKQIVAIKHKVAWKHYDKEVDYADPKNIVNSNKPKNTDEMGC
jgi:hypothetical protein